VRPSVSRKISSRPTASIVKSTSTIFGGPAVKRQPTASPPGSVTGAKRVQCVSLRGESNFVAKHRAKVLVRKTARSLATLADDRPTSTVELMTGRKLDPAPSSNAAVPPEALTSTPRHAFGNTSTFVSAWYLLLTECAPSTLRTSDAFRLTAAATAVGVARLLPVAPYAALPPATRKMRRSGSRARRRRASASGAGAAGSCVGSPRHPTNDLSAHPWRGLILAPGCGSPMIARCRYRLNPIALVLLAQSSSAVWSLRARLCDRGPSRRLETRAAGKGDRCCWDDGASRLGAHGCRARPDRLQRPVAGETGGDAQPAAVVEAAVGEVARFVVAAAAR
jgi:hypothetical protein